MRALVLSGGGAKGAYQVGALKRLMEEQRRDYDVLCGVSVGALNAAALAMAPLGKPEEAYAGLLSFWLALDNPRVWKKRALGNVASAFFAESIYDASPLHALVRGRLKQNLVASSGRRLRVGAVALDDGEYRGATERDPALIEWVLASSAFPVFFQPIEIGGRLWTDGGVRNVTPLGEAIALGADEIDVIMCSNPDNPNEWDPRGKKAYEVALRAIDLMGDEIVRTDLQVAGVKNEASGNVCEAYRKVSVRLIQPSKHLAENALDFTPMKIRGMMRLGYEDAAFPATL